MKSKLETKTQDILATLAAREAKQASDKAKCGLAMQVDAMATGPRPAQDPFCAAIELRRRELAAAATVARIPAPRRKLAALCVEVGEQIGRAAAARKGDPYSGDTSWGVKWGTRADADTILTPGKPYSRRVTYRRTNAAHTVTLDPAGIPALVEAGALRVASEREGLPLIALYPDGSAVWVVSSKGKTISAQRGWVAHAQGQTFHSVAGMANAQEGLRFKLDKLRKEREKASRQDTAARKEQHRAALVARLCKGAVATLADARALGFCHPGIAEFQARHGIGDSAPLPDLLKTGDPSAARLALAVARKVRRNPATV